MKIIIRVILVGLLFLFAVIVVVFGKYYRDRQEAQLNNVVFESSDGVWMDFTDNLKGRHFDSVVWTFEAYKLIKQKPDVTMIRITTRKERSKDLVEWKVPLGTSSGKARPFFSGTMPAQRAEIFKRAKLTLEYWKGK
jgi:hypothetical protein